MLVGVKVDDLRAMARTLGDVLPIDILTEDERDALAREMHLRRFKAGEVVYHRGDPGSDAFVVFSGLVKLVLIDEEGHEVIVALRARGEFFGELALFEDTSRDATAVAVSPTQVFQLSRASLAHVLDRNPKAREYAFRELAERIKALSAKYEDHVFLDVPGRLAKYLIELQRVRSEVPITQEDLAAAIGSTRVTVNKLLADFERRKLVRVGPRRVEVLDRAGLEAETRR
jgi:CRP-like cAMP-binding protein